MTIVSFILPDKNNQITDNDIRTGTLRITVSFKSYFSSLKGKISVLIGNESIEGSYTPRIGRSDRFFIGKKAMTKLNMKPGQKLKITKLGSYSFQIEKV